MAFIDQNTGSRRAVSVSAVVVVHLAIGYALITGLAYRVIKQEFPIIRLIDYHDPKVPPPLPIRHHEDQRRLAVPDHTKIIIPQEGDRLIIDTGPVKTEPTETHVTPLPPPTLSRALRPGRDHAGWVTSDDYPPSSVRNEEEGAVAISVRVGTDGRVSSCQVTASSGHPALDQATCRYYAKRARFTPAFSADGTPVESSYADRVVWRLPEQ